MNSEDVRAWIESWQAEKGKGGDQPPCPFCKVPRVKRNGYIRCSPCGVNWIGNEQIDRDPRFERLQKFLTEARATAPQGKKKDDGHAPE